MPFAADVDRFAPPARAVVVPAPANVPTVLTVDCASALKSIGSVDDDVEVAGIPIPSKFCVYGGETGTEIAERRTYVMTPRTPKARTIKILRIREPRGRKLSAMGTRARRFYAVV